MQAIPHLKAIVFDLDGTAVPNRHDGQPSARLRAAVATARTKLVLIPATGRSIATAQPIFKALGLSGPGVVSGGAVIVDTSTGKALHEELLSAATAARIAACAHSHGYAMHTPHDSAAPGAQPENHAQPTAHPIVYIPNVTAQHLTALVGELGTIPGISYTTARSYTGGHVININPKGASKESGIRRVLANLDIAAKNVAGVGDDDNDIHLFAAVGHRVAMGNATDTLKSAAHFITDRVEDDGLAAFIEAQL